jgi:transcriptional regulator with XRE-family HTH domain
MSEKFLVDYVALGEKLRQKRNILGLSQDAVSEKLGLSESFYGHIERGSKVLSVESLIKIARYYDMSLDFLLMDSSNSGNDKKLQAELDNIFRDKPPSQTDYLLNILKVLSANIEGLRPE